MPIRKLHGTYAELRPRTFGGVLRFGSAPPRGGVPAPNVLNIEMIRRSHIAAAANGRAIKLMRIAQHALDGSHCADASA